MQTILIIPKNLHFFFIKNYIFTMYQIWNGTQKQLDEFCNWSMNNHLNLYVHTVNDASAADRYLKQGVAGIYSDFLH